MMRHEHYATTKIYVEGVQRLLEGAEDAMTRNRRMRLMWLPRRGYHLRFR